MLLLVALVPLVLSAPVDVELPKTHVAYEDSFARQLMYPLAAAAYASHPQTCLTNTIGATVQRQVTVTCDGLEDSCSGFTAVSEKHKAIIVSFRGTREVKQLLEEGAGTLFHKKVKFANGGQVSFYFNRAWQSVWDGGMKYDFLTLKNKYESQGYELWITGHSLGGSMASLAASYIVSTNLYPASKIKLLTFGQPRTGDSTFAKNHDKQLPNAIRVTHAHDAVPHIPLEAMGYTHHVSEVFYDNNMAPGSKYVVCESGESKKCSDGNLTDLSVTDHFDYFNIQILDYEAADCKA